MLSFNNSQKAFAFGTIFKGDAMYTKCVPKGLMCMLWGQNNTVFCPLCRAVFVQHIEYDDCGNAQGHFVYHSIRLKCVSVTVSDIQWIVILFD